MAVIRFVSHRTLEQCAICAYMLDIEDIAQPGKTPVIPVMCKAPWTVPLPTFFGICQLWKLDRHAKWDV